MLDFIFWRSWQKKSESSNEMSVRNDDQCFRQMIGKRKDGRSGLPWVELGVACSPGAHRCVENGEME